MLYYKQDCYRTRNSGPLRFIQILVLSPTETEFMVKIRNKFCNSKI